MRNGTAMNALIATLALAALSAPNNSGESSRLPIEGLWKNPIGSAIIAIAPCGTALCGKVVWANSRGKSEVSKTTTHIVGTIVLTDLHPAGARWAGLLFIPDDNVHVSAKLRLVSERELDLTGCAFAGLFCRSQIWSRVTTLPRSD
jgi:uncharacterized protein (DUF2147 family)